MINIDSYLQKLRLLGLEINVINNGSETILYTSTIQEKDALLVIIPDNIRSIELRNLNTHREVMKVIGGTSLISANSMFRDCKANILDLTDLYTDNVEDMGLMFYSCQSSVIRLQNLRTSKVKNMNCMFSHCSVENLDLSSFDTSNVTDMYGMFNYFKAKRLDLSHFNIDSVKSMEGMFRLSTIEDLDISSFHIDIKKTKIYKIFDKSTIKRLKTTDKILLEQYNYSED